MNTTQENVVTAGQARRILEEILPEGATKEQIQSIIGSGILSELTQVDWRRFDRNLFCYNSGIPAFNVSNKTEVHVDYQVPLIKYWDAFIEEVRSEVETWLTEIIFPDLSELSSFAGKYAVIKCRREMSDTWLEKFMTVSGYLHVNHIELLSFYRQAFSVADRYGQIWALGKVLKNKNGNEFFPWLNKNASRMSGGSLSEMFNPENLNYNFRAKKDTCIVVRCISG